VPFNRALFGELLEASRDAHGAVCLRSANFSRAIFEGDASFGAVGARFEGGASFAEATFEGAVDFLEAAFAGPADFTRARFKGSAEFGTFEDTARFTQATFDQPAWFTTFLADVRFDGATFKGSALFDWARFEFGASFGGTSFERRVGFEWTEFKRSVGLRGATFEQAQDLGPLLVLESMDLDEASFLQPIDIKVSADRVTAVRARFAGGVNLQVRWAEIALEQSEFGAPSLVVGAEPFEAVADPRHYRAATGLGSLFARSRRLDETMLTERWQDDPSRSPRPCLLSLRRSNVEHLGLANVDLRACRFDGALNLAGLRTERGDVFARTPARYPGFRRQAIAEEHDFRKQRGGPRASGWLPAACELPAWFGKARRLEAREVSAILP